MSDTRQTSDGDNWPMHEENGVAPYPRSIVEVYLPLLGDELRAQYANITPIIQQQSPKLESHSPPRSIASSTATRPRVIVKKEEEDVDLFAGDAAAQPAFRSAMDNEPDLKPIKIKKEAPVLSHDSVQRRLQLNGCSPLDFQADREITKIGFKRLHLGAILGGNTVSMGSEPSQELYDGIHDLRLILYPNLDWNPHAPRGRGEPGLMLCGVGDLSPNHTIPLFSKIPRQKRKGGDYYATEPNLWYYLGHYVMQKAESLNSVEWQCLANLPRKKFIAGIMESTWGSWSRAEAAFCAIHNRAPTEEECRDLDARVKAKEKFTVTGDQVDRYYKMGWGRLAVSTLNCDRYDIDFQCELIARDLMREDGLLEEEYTRRRVLAAEKRKQNGSAVSDRPAKRKRKERHVKAVPNTPSEVPEDPSDNDVGAAASDGEEFWRPPELAQQEGVYIPKGTRSRPIAIQE